MPNDPPDASSGGTASLGNATPGGVTGIHQARRNLVVAPTVLAKQRNTLQLGLLPIACFRLEDLRFDFDSSFIRPEAASEMAALAQLRSAHPGAAASIFGHADPTGDDDNNKTLSGRRALATYALLVRDVARWEKLYDQGFRGDVWGTRSIQMMLGALGFDPGIVDGKTGPNTRDAIQGYQDSKGLTVDGDAGPQTRKALFEDYMDALCVDSSGTPFSLDPESDFLNKAADPGLVGDVQGCSEFNLVLVFSSSEDEDLQAADKKIERDAENLPNRRVMIFLFAPGSKLDPGLWPCPTAADGVAKCKAQFYPDGDKRRSVGDARRFYEQTRDTMACRFYDRMARRSPCEVARLAIRIRLLNSEGEVIPDAIYRLRLANGEVRQGQAKNGWLVEQNVEVPERVTIEWGYPPEFGLSDEERAKRWVLAGPFGYSLDMILTSAGDASDEDRAAEHLNNLGYPPERSLQENLSYFQRDFQVFPADGTLSDQTKAALAMVDDQGLSRTEFIAAQQGE